MKKGKYIDYNILLACLSHKSIAKNERQQPGTRILPGQKIVIELPATSEARRVA